jgi:hypothetical protein
MPIKQRNTVRDPDLSAPYQCILSSFVSARTTKGIIIISSPRC